ncbi:GNAT family N-acetyltransferase [Streptomyces sp. NPDC058240]|uniref:GNAT family N-acetyltransferase n=1 Tax=Streptomyces sp. NPDC058240 TaxID=3346396 RepID=UPI0036DFBD53
MFCPARWRGNRVTITVWRPAPGPPTLRPPHARPRPEPHLKAVPASGRDSRRVAYSFAVADSTDAALGSVAVSNVDPRHATGWVSYWTASAARGRGVATHGFRALADWCLADLGLFRLELGHRTDNPASCRAALASGFTAEGLQRQKLAYDGIRYDVEMHARLATDPQPAQQPLAKP